MDIEAKFNKAIGECQKAYPYMSYGFKSLEFIEVNHPEVETACIDKRYNIYYNKEFIESLTQKEINFLVYHELCHIIRSHPKRRKGRDAELWNIATDIEINSIPKSKIDRGVKSYTKYFMFTRGGVTCYHYEISLNFLSAEAYYDILDVFSPGSKKESSSGSGSDGDSRDYEVSDSDHMSEEEAEEITKSILNKIDYELSPGDGSSLNDKRGGKEYGYSKEYEVYNGTLLNKLNYDVDWRSILSEYVSQFDISGQGSDDYSIMHPNRRDYGGFIIPSMIESKKKVCMIIDVSSSMNEEELAFCYMQIDEINKEGNVEVDVIECNTDPVGIYESVRSHKDIKYKNIGGGTNMPRGVELAQSFSKYNLVVVLSDGDTPYNSVEHSKENLVYVLTRAKIPPVPNYVIATKNNKKI